MPSIYLAFSRQSPSDPDSRLDALCAVGAEMDISFSAADHRYGAWKKAGGPDREKLPLD